jgi:hypothetical protein
MEGSLDPASASDDDLPLAVVGEVCPPFGARVWP